MSHIARMDQHFLKIHEEIDHSTQNLLKRYKECLANVKYNPYLQVVIDEHKLYFQNIKKNLIKQIKALQRLLKIVTDQPNKSRINNEIKDLAKKLKVFK